MDCTNCGAPLPPKSNVCRYCSTLNETDLRAIRRESVRGPETERPCPRCKVPMAGLELKIGGGMQLERCDTCHGIFFDPDELELLLDQAVHPASEVDHARLNTIVDEQARPETHTVAYVPCPVCEKLMHRKNFGARSGVVVDRCKEHGVWLDGGELGQLLEWVKAGGREHEARREAENKKMAERAATQRYVRPEEKFSGQATMAPPREDDESGLLGVLGYVLRNWL